MIVSDQLCRLGWWLPLVWLSLVTWAEPAGNGTVNFAFDQADVRHVIRLVGDVTGKRFVLDDEVKGTVTLMGPAEIPTDQIYSLLLTILHSRGFSVLERDGVHQVMALPPRETAEAPFFGPDQAVTDATGLITRVLRIQQVSAVELRRMLEPMVRGGRAGALAVFPPTNHLIVTDTAESIRRLEQIIAELDRAGTAGTVEIVALQHASAEELAVQLNAAMGGAETAGRRFTRQVQQVTEGAASLAGEALVIAAPHANRLLLVGPPVQIAELKRIIQELDIESPSGYGRLNVIFLKYLNAEEAAKSLNGLIQRSAEREARPMVSVEPSIANNALLVDAAPRDFDLVQELIMRLDIPPQQVMVEILIAEVSAGKTLDLGVEWATIDAPRSGSTTIVGRSRPGQEDTLRNVLEGMFPEGLTVGVARGTIIGPNGEILPRVPFLVRALAQDRDVKILSNIPLWAQNNMEASVSVVDNIPILRSTIEGGAGTARDVIQNIERLDVGIQLKVTPYVNPDNEVRLKLNPIIEAIIDDGPSDMRFAPTIARREVDTTVTIPDRATVVLSGMMREDRIRSVSKVPFLGDLPLIGVLFRRNIDRTQRTNLLIFVTPHIVTDLRAAEELRDQLGARTQIDYNASSIVPAQIAEDE